MRMSTWDLRAKNLLKAEIVRQGVTYDQLREKLSKIGINETVAGINVKINRGTFSFAFFLQCMKALDIKIIHLDI